MWYVIQTKSGDEEIILATLRSFHQPKVCRRCFAPLYEEVRRSRGQSRIVFQRLFPEYLFVETDQPEEIVQMLRTTPRFGRVLGAREEDGRTLFLPIDKSDEDFLMTLFEDGVMHVSYVQLSKSNRIERVVGPLAGYRNHITKLELRHRMAIVEADLFGKKRKIKFGLWTDGDPSLPWLLHRMERNEEQPLVDDRAVADIGIKPGDWVMDDTGVYGDIRFMVERVDAIHRKVYTTLQLGTAAARVELNADEVSVSSF